MHGVVMLPRKRATVSRFVPNFPGNFVYQMNSDYTESTRQDVIVNVVS